MESLLQIDVYLQVSGITLGRAAAILPAVIGLLGIITGWWVLARPSHRISSNRLKAIMALAMGLICMALSALI